MFQNPGEIHDAEASEKSLLQIHEMGDICYEEIVIEVPFEENSFDIRPKEKDNKSTESITWKDNMIKTLIMFYELAFDNGCRAAKIWSFIEQEMNKLGYQVSEDQCRWKYYNLLKRFRALEEKVSEELEAQGEFLFFDHFYRYYSMKKLRTSKNKKDESPQCVSTPKKKRRKKNEENSENLTMKKKKKNENLLTDTTDDVNVDNLLDKLFNKSDSNTFNCSLLPVMLRMNKIEIFGKYISETLKTIKSDLAEDAILEITQIMQKYRKKNLNYKI